MTNREQVRSGQQVIGSDGGMIGRVIRVHDDHLHVEPTAPAPDAPQHTIPLDWVARVDDHVHLTVTAATARDRWRDDEPPPSSPYEVSYAVDLEDERKSNWIPWVIGLILLGVIIVVGFRSCAFDETDFQGNAADLNGALDDVEGRAGPLNGQ